MLPKEAVEEFKQIYFKEEGRELSDQEAVALANNLMGLFKRMYTKPGSKFESNSVSHNKMQLTKK